MKGLEVFEILVKEFFKIMFNYGLFLILYLVLFFFRKYMVGS